MIQSLGGRSKAEVHFGTEGPFVDERHYSIQDLGTLGRDACVLIDKFSAVHSIDPLTGIGRDPRMPLQTQPKVPWFAKRSFG